MTAQENEIYQAIVETHRCVQLELAQEKVINTQLRAQLQALLTEFKEPNERIMSLNAQLDVAKQTIETLREQLNG